MTAAAEVLMPSPAPMPFVALPVGLIDESPTNPRTHFDAGALAELAESIVRFGVLQPILVRPRGERYELVAGHRRFRATRSIPLETIPAIVQELGDKEVLEVQVVENLQRADLHPLEEAEGYARLLREFGYDADSLALKIGKSRSYVYGRMKLAVLCDEVKAAMYDGKLPHSHALLIARIADPKLQKKALAICLDGFQWRGEAISYRDAKNRLEQGFTKMLGGASFDPADAELVPAAGACAVCPYRAGNLPDFDATDEDADADVCTHTPCYDAKAEAAWQREGLAIAAKNRSARSVRVLTLAESEKAARYGQVQSKAWADLAAPCELDPKRRRLGELLPADAPIALLRTGYGNVREVVAQKDLAEQLERAGHKFEVPKKSSTRGSVSSKDLEAQRREADRERKIEEAVRNAVGLSIVARVESFDLNSVQHGVMVDCILRGALLDLEGGVPPELERLKLKRKDEEKWAKGLTSIRLLALLAEHVYAQASWDDDAKRRRAEFFELIGLDESGIEARIRRGESPDPAAIEPKAATVKKAVAKPAVKKAVKKPAKAKAAKKPVARGK